MQHHPPCSREVFRHWCVTIIKTPKVRKMTKATLFDSFYASCHNETVNYVADCADRPVCPVLKLINKHIRELEFRETRWGGALKKTYSISSQEKLSQTPEQSNYNWPDRFVFKQGFKRRRPISQHVMLQPGNFVISNISKAPGAK